MTNCVNPSGSERALNIMTYLALRACGKNHIDPMPEWVVTEIMGGVEEISVMATEEEWAYIEETINEELEELLSESSNGDSGRLIAKGKELLGAESRFYKAIEGYVDSINMATEFLEKAKELVDAEFRLYKL